MQYVWVQGENDNLGYFVPTELEVGRGGHLYLNFYFVLGLRGIIFSVTGGLNCYGTC